MTTGLLTADEVRDAWHAAWNTGQVDALDAILAPQYLRYTASNREGQGLAAFKESIALCRAAFPDLSTAIVDLVREGDRIAIRWESAGTHSGSMLGVPPTGRSVAVSGATFAHLDSGLIHAEHVTWDPRALLTALGIISLESGA
ncbi:steroid delta-isomerase-like uncharacterized protein [Spinactinospora alkalitolerans]|uniref:Steroid delta-isomerase-like uncharacterized protein n=1 Tax=Spinactinospora alkalitolerans TaxID=687207 RepID=A0A852TWR4_9ACTN|nr:ester cyclase [Spinactinospora alkalitolerans]NYE47825.1 steroid delta-isomerase-like uncharacterized protein [Spinactinospora alkalitolerans]